ncbi:MAG: peptide chain release factor-like protein [Phycisphaerae bacterium]|nr:peptide chain release factor-like protein [Phycisphaerae bacterium]
MSPLLHPDDRLLAECRIDHFRGSGPGGQKRNKTANGIRLTHIPTRSSATATESRSLGENKLFALRRLRLKLACELRQPIDLLKFDPPDWFLELRHEQHLAVSHRHTHYAAVGGLMLDLLAALNGNPAAVAINLGINTTSVIRFLEDEPAFWTAANRIRASAGLEPLSHRR